MSTDDAGCGCAATVTWYDLDATPRRCVLDRHRDGHHYDGSRWFNRHGLEAPALPRRATTGSGSTGVAQRTNAGWKERTGRPRRVDARHQARTDRLVAS